MVAYAFIVPSMPRGLFENALHADAANLRSAAEARLSGASPPSPSSAYASGGASGLAQCAPPTENQAGLLHELQVRQLELEIQNEALQQGNAALERAKADIEAGLQRYLALYELAPLAYFTLDSQGLVLKTNHLGQARLGQALHTVRPQRFAALLEEASLPVFHDFLQKIFKSQGQDVREKCELSLRARPGHPAATVEVTGIAVAGQASCNIAMVDMTDRIAAGQEIERLNEALEMRVAQLAEANDDLEAFSSAVAHDLQTPLTALDGFRVLLERALQEGDSALAHHCTQRIGMLISQMGQTTSGLLSLARVSRDALQWADCDLTQMSTEIVQALREHNPTRQVEVIIEPGLHAYGDPALLRQLLANLLGNAWKFTSAKPLARIQLTRDTASRGGRQRYFVLEDNGAGFEMAQAGRLFGAFERLHSPSEFPGSGIGLATVKRIVTRHGGHISACGVPGQGARFRFSLPAQAQPAAKS